MKKSILTLTRLKKELKKYNFIVKKQHEADLFNWAEFWYKGKGYLIELILEIVEMGKCEACGMPEYIIYHERQADNMYRHLVCEGCGKVCDGGETRRENDYYSFHSRKCGAYVFWKIRGGREETDKWFCAECKFEKLCGDCGGIHNGDFWNEGEHAEGEKNVFWTCSHCGEDEADRQHEDEHWKGNEPDIFCPRCSNFVEKYNEAEKEYTLAISKRNQREAERKEGV